MGKKIITVLCCLFAGAVIGAAGIAGASVLFDVDLGGFFSGDNYVTLPQGGENWSAAVSSVNPERVKPGDTYIWTITLGNGYDKAAPKVTFKDSADKEITPVNFVEGDVVDGIVTYSFKVTQAVKIEVEPQINNYAVTLPSESVQVGYSFEGETGEAEHGGEYAFKVILDDSYNLNALTVRANGIVIPDVVNNSRKTITINEDTAITVDVLTKNTYKVTRPVGGAGFAVVDSSHGTNVAGLSHGAVYYFTVQLEEGYLETMPVFTGTTAGVVPVLDEELSEPATGKYVYSFDVTQNTELKISAIRDGDTFGVYDNYDVIWPIGVKPILIEVGATTVQIQEAFERAEAQELPFEETWVAFENPHKEEGTVIYPVTRRLIISDNINISGNNATLRVCVDSVTGVFVNPGEFAIVNEGFSIPTWTRSSIDRTFSIINLNFEKYAVAVSSSPEHLEGVRALPSTLFGCGVFTDGKIIDCNFVCTVSEEVKEAFPERSDVPFDAYTSYVGLTLKGCTFRQETDATAGGVWIRNLNGIVDAKNVLIEGCKFYKCGADEMLAIWPSVASKALSDVTVRSCEFYFYKGKNNPVFCLGFGLGDATTGATSDILFTGNKLYADNVTTLFYIASEQTNVKRVTVSDNEFTVTGLLNTNLPLIDGRAGMENCVVRNNIFTVNDGNIKRNTFVSGRYLDFIGNEIYGNAVDNVAGGLNRFEDNYVESCGVAGGGARFFLNNTIDSCDNYFYRILNLAGTVSVEPPPVIRGNVFRAGKNVSLTNIFQFGSYLNVVFEYNTFYGLTLDPNAEQAFLINVWDQRDTSLVFRNNTFYLDTANKFGIAIGSGNSTVSEFIGNRLINAEGVDLLHDTSPDKLTWTPIWRLMPVGSTVLFKVKKETQTGWLKKESGWEVLLAA